jgi:hypothetical protein
LKPLRKKINRAYLPIIELTPNPAFHWDITSKANAQARPFRINPGGLDDAFQPFVLGNIDESQQQAVLHILQGPMGLRYGSVI